jgi:hypothetical protein
VCVAAEEAESEGSGGSSGLDGGCSGWSDHLVYVAVCVWLIVTGKGNADDWERNSKMFGSLTPLAGAAIGWVFGREVHRKAADDATKMAKEYRADALMGRELAAKVKAAAAMELGDEAARDASSPTAASPAAGLAFVQHEAERMFPMTASDTNSTN